jgi:3-mercaptopyruvate sulfurtransferase SseA
VIGLRATLAMVAATAGIAAAAAGPGSRHAPSRAIASAQPETAYISAPDLADRIIRRDATLQILDVRSPREYDELHIASARQVSTETLTREDAGAQGIGADDTIVVYGDNAAVATRAWELLRQRGHRHVFVLREGLYEWISRVIEPRLAADATPKERDEFDRAASQSRFFGGLPRAEVARSEVPTGYWTGRPTTSPNDTRQAVAAVRRRGC